MDEHDERVWWYPEHGLEVHVSGGEVRINLPVEASLHPDIALKFAMKIMEAAGTAEGRRAGWRKEVDVRLAGESDG